MQGTPEPPANGEWQGHERGRLHPCSIANQLAQPWKGGDEQRQRCAKRLTPRPGVSLLPLRALLPRWRGLLWLETGETEASESHILQLSVSQASMGAYD